MRRHPVLRSECRLYQDGCIARFALSFPVFGGEPHGADRVPLKVEAKPGFLLQVQLLAPQAGFGKPVVQRLDALSGGRGAQGLVGEREAQQERIGARPVFQQSGDFGGPVLVEEEVRKGGEQEVVRDAKRERVSEKAFRQLRVTEPAR